MTIFEPLDDWKVGKSRYGNYGWKENVVTIPVHGLEPDSCELCDKDAVKTVSYNKVIDGKEYIARYVHYFCQRCFDDPDVASLIEEYDDVTVSNILKK